MPEQTEAASEEAASEPKVRRISNKNPRKTAKAPKSEPESEVKLPNEVDVPSEEFDHSSPSTPDESDSSPDSSGESKRKNRRRRGKGKPKAGEAEETVAESKAEEAPEQRDRQPQRAQQVPQPQKARRKLDPEKVAKNAWKIFLAEVSEEGVALIGDNDARELARRCFRLSEIFLEEEDRRG